MSRSNSLNPDYHLPPPIPTWVKAATYTSATALAVSTVAMVVLLTIYSHMGIVSFSALAGAEGLSLVFFAVSFYLLNKKQNERIEQIRYVAPPPMEEVVVEREREETPPPDTDLNRRPPPPQTEIPVVGERAEIHPLDADWERRDQERVVLDEDDRPPPLLDADLGEFVEIGGGIPQADLVLSSTSAATTDTREPTPVRSLEYIDEFRRTLPEMFAAGEEFAIAFVSAYYRSTGSRPSRGTIRDIQESIQLLARTVDAILQDKVQLFRFALGALVTSFVEDELLQQFLERENDPMAFLRYLPTMVPEGRAREQEELTTTRHLLTMIANGARIEGRSDQRELQSLYSALQKASRQLTEANQRLEQEQRKEDNDKKIQTAQEKVQDKETEYNGALMGIVDWLFFRCDVEEAQLNEMVANNVSPTIDLIREGILEQLPMIVWQIKGAYGPEGLLSGKIVKAGLYTATAVNGKLIRSQVNKVISSLPLDRRYERALVGLVEQLIPTLTNPIYDVTVGDAGVFSSDPHPFRAAFKDQIVDRRGFNTLVEVPETMDWPGYAAVYAQILRHFAGQLNELRF